MAWSTFSAAQRLQEQLERLRQFPNVLAMMARGIIVQTTRVPDSLLARLVPMDDADDNGS